MNEVCVLGLGYIGLPTAATLATHGLSVLGVDVNERVLSTLRDGGIHLHEPGLNTLVQASLKSGNLTVAACPEPSDVFIIAVPTPIHDDKSPDLSAVSAAAEAIVPHLRAGNLVLLESTSPPGTTANLVAPILEQSGLRAGSDFHLAYSPERVLPGQILSELLENARVIGGIDRASAEAGRDLYGVFVRGEIVLTDSTTAEMVKLMENAYRDVNIAIANEFAQLADHFGVDVWEAIQIANLHPRVNILAPGPGVGGHCISVDPWFLVHGGSECAPLICTARSVNDGQPRFVVELIRRALGDLDGKRVAVLGLAYKRDVDDLRESPAIEVARLLGEAGAVVQAFEPHKPGVSILGEETARSLAATVRDSEAIVLLTAHREFRELTPQALIELSPARIVIDCVRVWDSELWRAHGFRMYKLGVGQRS